MTFQVDIHKNVQAQPQHLKYKIKVVYPLEL